MWRAGDTLGLREGAGPARSRSAAVSDALRQVLKQGPSRAMAYLDLFAGAGAVGRWLRRHGAHNVLRLDLKDNPAFDLSCAAVCRTLCGWIGSRHVRGLFIAFPLSTWSRASRGRYRSASCIHGWPDLDPVALRNCLYGNRTLLTTVRLIRAAVRAGVPVIVENPYTSMAWLEPSLASLMRHSSCITTVCDFCQFGKPWRKRTRLAGWNVISPPADLHRTCGGKCGICSRTGRRHIALEGRQAGYGQMTAAAEAYPAEFAAAAARWLRDSANAIETVRLNQLIV